MSDSRHSEQIPTLTFKEVKKDEFVNFFGDSKKDSRGDLVENGILQNIGNFNGRAVKVNQDDTKTPYFGVTFTIDVLASAPQEGDSTLPPVPGETLAILAKTPENKYLISFRDTDSTNRSARFSKWHEVKEGETKQKISAAVQSGRRKIPQPMRFNEKTLRKIQFKLI